MTALLAEVKAGLEWTPSSWPSLQWKYLGEDTQYGHRLAEPTSALIVSLAGDYKHVVAPVRTDVMNILPRVASLLEGIVITDISGVVDADTFERPI